jgi:transcriptional regulator with XRE-family HTH domain/signal transduction histidine kinase
MPGKHDISFGQWVKRRRKTLGITQEQLATHIGCAVVTIRKIESDERRPSLDVAHHLCQALQVPAANQAMFLQVAIGQADVRILTRHLHTGTMPHVGPLIGREADCERVLAHIQNATTRLITITGPVGIGKTHLVLALGAELYNHFTDGVAVIDLSSVHAAADVAQSIAQTLGIVVSPQHDLLDALVTTLAELHFALILDNFEQVLAARTLVQSLLADCPWLSILVTSREPLGLHSEQIIRLPPLTLPPEGVIPTIDSANSYGSLALFIERTRQINPAFPLTQATLVAATTVCRQLDGIPLAISIVAAHTAWLLPQQSESHVLARLALLMQGSHDLPSRHHTLQAALDWGYDLLSAQEQRLLARLAVLVGSWTIQTAITVCDLSIPLELAPPASPEPPGQATTAPMTQLVLGLVQKSFILQQQLEDGTTWFRMLGPIQAYAYDRLLAGEELDLIEQRHAIYYGYYYQKNPAQSPIILAYEQDNIRSALKWAIKNQAVVLSMRLVEVLTQTQQAMTRRLLESQATNAVLNKLVAERTRELEQNMAELVNRETRLQHVHSELLLATSLKMRFLHAISHEIHTAVNIMGGFTHLIERAGALNERQQYLLSRIRINSTNLGTTMEHIVELFSLETQPLMVQCVETSLADLLEQVLLSPEIAQPGVSLNIDIAEDVPLAFIDPAGMAKDLAVLLRVAGFLRSSGAVLVKGSCADGTIVLRIIVPYGSFGSLDHHLVSALIGVIPLEESAFPVAMQFEIALCSHSLAAQGCQLALETTPRGAEFILHIVAA